jgi:peroxiredoxin Q/BCP
MSKILTVGDKALGFSAPDQKGKVHSLADYKGKWLLLYFYPKDNTDGCTREACKIRDAWSLFEGINMSVLGVSADSVDSHKDFAEEYKLPFPILADEDKKIIGQYGAWGEKSMYGHKYMGILRMSYIISPDGKIAKIYPKVQSGKHAAEVLKDMKTLQV